MALPTPPEGTHELFLVFINPSASGTDGLLNLNYFTALGKGAANSAAPEVTASADPTTGERAPEVQFTGTATDPDAGAGRAADLPVGLRRGRHDGRHVDPAQPDLHVRAAGHVPGAASRRPTRTARPRPRPSRSRSRARDECPQNNVTSDEFEGDSLDTNRWQIIRPDGTRPPTVSGGNLNFPIDNGSLYGPGTSTRNIIVQPLPSGDGRGDGEDHHRSAHRELPAGRPARLPGRRELGLGPHDPRGRRA